MRAPLTTCWGYTKINNVKFVDGAWKADARSNVDDIWNAQADDPSGRDVVLKVDPATGKVIGREKD